MINRLHVSDLLLVQFRIVEPKKALTTDGSSSEGRGAASLHIAFQEDERRLRALLLAPPLVVLGLAHFGDDAVLQGLYSPPTGHNVKTGYQRERAELDRFGWPEGVPVRHLSF